MIGGPKDFASFIDACWQARLYNYRAGCRENEKGKEKKKDPDPVAQW